MIFFKGSLKNIKNVYVHPQTYDQCTIFIQNHLSTAQVTMTRSNAESAQMLQSNGSKGSAAIVPSLALEHYRLQAIKKNIQDKDYNVTRFFVIGKRKMKRSGHDKTSIAVTPNNDRPGLLCSMLLAFADRKINLTKLESRPAKSKLGDYVFFIDFQGHRDEADVKEAFADIGRELSLKVLGSYPEAY